MKQVLYSRCLLSAEQTPQKFAVLITVTEEVNCFIIWLTSHDEGPQALKIFVYDRNKALEWAIIHAHLHALALEVVEKSKIP